jgi:type IV pilus assembly protein PilQ
MRAAALVIAAAVVAPVVAAVPAAAAEATDNDHRKVTIDVMGADVINVIRLLGDVSGKNVVVADDVKGKVTIKLKNVEWRAALDIILKSVDAGVLEEGTILWVVSQARIDAMERAELDKAYERELRGPLFTRVIQLNNAKASDMAALVKPLLSTRGAVTFDEATNVLIVRDVKGSFALQHRF